MTCIEKSHSRIKIVDKAVSISHDSLKFTLVPYVAPGRFVEAMEESGVKDWRESRVIFAHQEFKGCKMGAIVSEHGDEWPEDAPIVVSGHIHDNQRPQENIYYPGAPIQHSYGDAGDNVVVLIKVDEEDVSFHEVQTGCGNKKTKTVTLEKIEDFLKKGVEEDVDLKINVTGDANELKAFQKSKKYKELTEKGIKVNLKPTVIEMVPLSEDKEETPIESDFHTILMDLLEKDKSTRLMRDYTKIFFNREEEDVLVL
jgi:DNA repair exonuclease SbcCD nuclease subunit